MMDRSQPFHDNDDPIEEDPDGSRNVLEAHGEGDSVSWLRQNGAQVTACVSNFSTSYNVVNISLVLPILLLLQDGAATSEDAAVCASSLLAGMMLGQVVGGALGDTVWLGRLGALRLVMALQVVASLASASIGLFLGPASDIFVSLAIWRFVLGIGCGGVYPLAAVLSAEQANVEQTTREENNQSSDNIQNRTVNNETTDGFINDDAVDDEEQRRQAGHTEDMSKSIHRVVLTFSTQGLGFVTVPIVAVILLYCTDNLQLIWRLMLGLGALPGLILLVFQGFCLGTSRNGGGRSYTGVSQQVPIEDVWEIDYDHDNNNNNTDGDAGGHADHAETEGTLENDSVLASDFDEGDIEDHPIDHESERETNVTGIVGDGRRDDNASWIQSLFHEPGLGQKVMGTAGTWFLFDVVFYGNTIFQPIVVEAAFGGSSSDNPIHLLRKTAIDSLILTSLALPGYAVAGIVMGKKTCCITQTPRYVMLQGFSVMAVLYFTIGVNWSYLRGYPTLLVVLYGGTFFFANYGPNTTTFILPSLLFEKENRATWNGLSAAAGKLGALTGATLFEPAADAFGDSVVMLICSGVAVLAYILTFLFVPRQQGMNSSTSQQMGGRSSVEATTPSSTGQLT